MPLTDVAMCAFCQEERPMFALAMMARPASEAGFLGLAGVTQKRRFCTDRGECRKAAAAWKEHRGE